MHSAWFLEIAQHQLVFKPQKVCYTMIVIPSSEGFFKSFHQVVCPVFVTTNRTSTFWKSHITLLFFFQSQDYKCALVLYYVPPNFKKIDKNMHEALQFLKCAKKRKKKRSKIRRTLDELWIWTFLWWLGRFVSTLKWDMTILAVLGCIQALLSCGCMKIEFSWFLCNAHLSAFHP